MGTVRGREIDKPKWKTEAIIALSSVSWKFNNFKHYFFKFVTQLRNRWKEQVQLEISPFYNYRKMTSGTKW